MIHLILAGAANFIFIFLKAFQQRNVAFMHYNWVVPTSMSMALVEVYVISVIASKGFFIPLILSVGLGGGLGAIAAMFIHKKFVGNKVGSGKEV